MMDSEENGLLNLNRQKWSNLNITPLCWLFNPERSISGDWNTNSVCA